MTKRTMGYIEISIKDKKRDEAIDQINRSLKDGYEFVKLPENGIDSLEFVQMIKQSEVVERECHLSVIHQADIFLNEKVVKVIDKKYEEIKEYFNNNPHQIFENMFNALISSCNEYVKEKENILSKKIESELNSELSKFNKKARNLIEEMENKVGYIPNKLKEIDKDIIGINESIRKIRRIVNNSDEKLLNMDISEIFWIIDNKDYGFDKRSINVLKSNGIFKVKDLLSKNDIYMRSLPNVGRKSMNQINEFMGALGLEFNEKDIE